MKTVARILLAALWLQICSPPGTYAQQAHPAPGNIPTAPRVAIPERKPLPVPELTRYDWKVYGAHPLVDASCLPEGYGKDKDVDVRVFRDFVEGIKVRPDLTDAQARDCHDRLKAAASLVFFRSTKLVPKWFWDEFQANIRAEKFITTEFRNGHVFWPCGMAFTPKGSNRPRFEGNAFVQFDEPLWVWYVDPIYMREGPYEGHALAPVIPTKCINLTCMDAVIVPESFLPDPNAPKTKVPEGVILPPQVQFPGPSGPQGPIGPIGPDGPSGPSGPSGVKGLDGECEDCGIPRWIKVAIPILAGAAIAGWFLGRSKTVVVDGRKGTTSPGTRP